MLYKTEHGNNYYVNRELAQIFFINPILAQIIEKNGKEGAGNRQNIKAVEKSGDIKDEEHDYYNKKYEFLKRSGILHNGHHTKKDYHKYNGEDLRNSIANSKQIVFEVTESCNLKCKYCGFGEMYEGYDKRSDRKFDLGRAKLFLDYMKKLWDSDLNTSIGTTIYIAFYGGEPLTNFPFVEEIVNYVRSLKIKKYDIRYALTTNAVFLKKHIDFLVENDFILTVSIDGNEHHNQYRVFKNGKNSYKSIEKNMLFVKEKYPKFYSLNIYINSVFHNKSSYSSIQRHLLEKFSKTTNISELTKRSISEIGSSQFNNYYASFDENFRTELSRDPSIIDYHDFFKDMLADIFRHYNRYSFENYNFLLGNTQPLLTPTGTCIPLERKIYVTISGKILPCEKINYQFSLGNLSKDGVEIDFDMVAKKYNKLFEMYEELCGKCYFDTICGNCVLLVDNPLDSKISCSKYKNKYQFKNYMAEVTTYFEKKPESYNDIF